MSAVPLLRPVQLQPASYFKRSCLLHSVPVSLASSSTARRVSILKSGTMASLGSASLEAQGDPAILASKDLLIVGPGVLGKQIAGLWMKEFPGCSITGQTATTNHHAELESLGIKPSLKGTLREKGFSFVVFCAPPSGIADYPGELRLATELWNGQGVFLFTSSSAVYDCADNGVCNEVPTVIPHCGLGLHKHCWVRHSAPGLCADGGLGPLQFPVCNCT